MENVDITRKPDPCERLMQFFNTKMSYFEDIPNGYEIRDSFKTLAETLLLRVPHNQELTLALRSLQEAQYYCFEAIQAE